MLMVSYITVYVTIPGRIFTEREASSALLAAIRLRVIPAHTRSSRAYGRSEDSFRDCGMHFSGIMGVV